jgi:hypothetical protein
MPCAQVSMLRATGLSLMLSLFVSSCGQEKKKATESGKLPACARNDAVAIKVGCTPLGALCEPLPAACDALADVFFNCVERDLRQCICEQSDAKLNCEGAFKPNEGPALCIEEYVAFDDCLSDEAS